MSSPLNQNLENALREMIEACTFSLEGVKAIEALRAIHEQSLAKIEELTRVVNDKQQQLLALGAERDVLKRELAVLQSTEQHLRTREKEQTRLECKVEKHEAVANAYRDAFMLVFKNPVVQQSTFGSVPIAYNGGYNTASSSSTMETKINP